MVGNSLTDMYASVMMKVFNTLWSLTPTEDKYKAFIESYTVCEIKRFFFFYFLLSHAQVLPLGYYKKGKEVLH
jgi:hypothetical protein